MCSERSLKRWIIRYEKDKSIKLHNRKPIYYKIYKRTSKIRSYSIETKLTDYYDLIS